MALRDALADPVRRRIVEVLSDGETSAGDLTSQIRAAFGISQPAVSQHLRVLREAGCVTVRAAGNRRISALTGVPFAALADWLTTWRGCWAASLDDLDRIWPHPIWRRRAITARRDPYAERQTRWTTRQPGDCG